MSKAQDSPVKTSVLLVIAGFDGSTFVLERVTLNFLITQKSKKMKIRTVLAATLLLLNIGNPSGEPDITQTSTVHQRT